MSMKDQLFQAGFLSKKELRKANQDSKKKRRSKQGNRKKKRVLAAEDRAAAEKKRSDRIESLKEERQEREVGRLEKARHLQVFHILSHHRLRYRRADHPFWHVAADGKTLHKLLVPDSVAMDTRAGSFAIVVIGDMAAEEPDYAVVPREVALRVRGLEPERILFLNDDAPDSKDPAERLFGQD
jgi:uncharacterized protein YaiL (DUF2058 family)